ncbi:MAG: TusE/DsrC/DsvC family sulfur relay protein [Bifidobacteriaceae bacterium]|jgi:tRNA 2-thiouridine synthesizing protein E|nr:TusE/DsrC/DsvC family sulfur relay protein [Bifidobacteriaceae bacterium]
MPVNNFLDREIDVNEEGFLTDPAQWDRELAEALAPIAGLGQLTEEHWAVLEFARESQAQTGQSPTLRRLAAGGGFVMADLFRLFPGKPAKKIAYIAGLPKPVGCV